MKIGDMVRLISGGPVMTVVFADRESVVCAWFDNGDYKDHGFPIYSLVRVDSK